jgi:disulfide bond formation protein DsbB
MAAILKQIPFLDEDNILPLAALLVCAGAIAVIASALAFQYIGGIQPCPLCYRQRWVYYFAIPLAAVAFVLALYEKRDVAVLALTITAAGFAVNAGFGVHHAGVEWGWWAGPASCAADELSKPQGSVLEMLKTAPDVRCDEASWRFLGLSFAGYNAIISAGLAVIAFAGSWFGRRREE